MEWSVEAIDRLRALWAEGLSTAEIGRRMGVSKNAVVGKAHRLKLPARPSPIRRDPSAPRPAPGAAAMRAPAPRGGPAPAAPAATPVRRLSGIAATGLAPQGGDAATPLPPASTARARAGVAGAPATAAVPVPPQAAVVRGFPRLGAVRSCCWPIGEPGTPEFRFCGGEAMPGKPYCAEHAAVAYVKARDRREDAA